MFESFFFLSFLHIFSFTFGLRCSIRCRCNCRRIVADLAATSRRCKFELHQLQPIVIRNSHDPVSPLPPDLAARSRLGVRLLPSFFVPVPPVVNLLESSTLHSSFDVYRCLSIILLFSTCSLHPQSASLLSPRTIPFILYSFSLWLLSQAVFVNFSVPCCPHSIDPSRLVAIILFLI